MPNDQMFILIAAVVTTIALIAVVALLAWIVSRCIPKKRKTTPGGDGYLLSLPIKEEPKGCCSGSGCGCGDNKNPEST